MVRENADRYPLRERVLSVPRVLRATQRSSLRLHPLRDIANLVLCRGPLNGGWFPGQIELIEHRTGHALREQHCRAGTLNLSVLLRRASSCYPRVLLAVLSPE